MIFEDLQVLIFHYDDLQNTEFNNLLFLVIAGLSDTSSKNTKILKNSSFLVCSGVQLFYFEFLQLFLNLQH